MKYSFPQIKEYIGKLAEKIQAPENLLPTYGNSQDGKANIDIGTNGVLSYEVKERGETLIIHYPPDLDHLAYIVFRNLSYEMAARQGQDLESSERDSRRYRFERQLELLGKLNEEWAQRAAKELEGFLFTTPFNDKEGQREAYVRKLMGDGFLRDEAIKKAEERFP